MILFSKIVGRALALSVCVTAAAWGAQSADVEILGRNSHWQLQRVSYPALVRLKDGGLVPLAALKGHYEKGGYTLSAGEKPATPAWPALPSEWAAPGFDDSDWELGRSTVIVNGFYLRSATDGRRNLALVRLRGRFVVNDPAAIESLTLNLRYQGGVVVYVNGHEVARGHLGAAKTPDGKPTAVTHDIPGDDYPDESVVAPDGTALSEGYGDPEKHKDRFALRHRLLSGVVLPGRMLVKGVNVLAIELHRSPMPEAQTTARHPRRESWWTALELRDLQLIAPSGEAVTPNAGKPVGLHVWGAPPTWRVGNDEIGNRALNANPMKIVACRNGVFSGQAVVIADRPISPFSAKAGDLRQNDGAGVIPANAMQIRYALPDGIESVSDNGGNGWFDGLEETPPASVPLRIFNPRPWDKSLDKSFLAVQPVWVTVRVPVDAAPGTYRGTLLLDTGEPTKTELPIELKVHGWKAPDAKAYDTFVEMNQSPETLARFYKKPMWSEEHWRLVERSFSQIGQIGCKTLFIPLIARARFGNDHGMLHWVKQDSGWRYDSAILERYLDMAITHLGNIPVVNFHISEPSATANYWKVRGLRQDGYVHRPQVTVRDAVTGELSLTAVPAFGTDESRAFWAPVFDRLRAIMKARGLTGSMMVGTEHDLGFDPNLGKDLKAVAAGFRWVTCTHPGPPESGTTRVGIPLGYAINVWQGWEIPPVSSRRLYGWKWREEPERWIHCKWPRTDLPVSSQMGMIGGVLEGLMVGGPVNSKQGYPGLGYQGADFWRISDDKGRAANILDLFAEAKWGSLNIENGCEYWLRPGAAGPLGTARLEVLREGIEEANARAFIERALLDPARRARLDAATAEAAQKLLDERTALLARCRQSDFWYDWLAGATSRRDRLLAAATAVASRLGP